MFRRLLLALTLAGPSVHAETMATEASSCAPAIAAAESRFKLPGKLLGTIAIVESGRPDKVTGRTTPWPWTINVAGVGYVYATKSEAIAAVQGFQALGVRSIDVGCVQINLMYHPSAFATLEEAFDPDANTVFGAGFLTALYHQTGNWPRAAAAYHSQTPEIGKDYERKVMALWPLAARFPDPGLDAPLPGAQPVVDTTHYTPEFAAHLREAQADLARLHAQFGPLVGGAGHPTAPPKRAATRTAGLRVAGAN